MLRAILPVAIAASIVGVACRRDQKHHQGAFTVQEQRAHLLKRINRLGDVNEPGTPRPLVTLEEFFEGNTDFASIGYNFYADQPAPSEFYSFFTTIRSNPMVADVRVEVSQHDDPDAWPVSDTVWIITAESRETVARWLGERFAADELLEGFSAERTYEPLVIPHGMRAVGVWWD